MAAENTTRHAEAYYLYLIAGIGLFFNSLVILCIIFKKSLRRMTSAFLVHACLLNEFRSMFCILFANNLLSQRQPSNCDLEGSTYIVIMTVYTFNMVAMVCCEAYTFGETNIGGDAKGTFCCVLFGLVMVYIGSLILHLGPTLIGGYFGFHPDIGNCSFILGQVESYVAYTMWIAIVSLALVAIAHYISRLYKEIQVNQPNRVSMLVRSSICFANAPKVSESSVRAMVDDSLHRAKLFIAVSVSFAACWYPLFALILIDMKFQVSPKVYQAFSFIAWTQSAIEPILYTFLDRKLNLFVRYVSCGGQRKYDMETIVSLMSQYQQAVAQQDLPDNETGQLRRQQQQPQQQQQHYPHHHHHHHHHHHPQQQQQHRLRQQGYAVDETDQRVSEEYPLPEPLRDEPPRETYPHPDYEYRV
ncbi:sphingosine 1-phosphate receptor 1-like [Octopus sinensis]|uniref:Sphingosine 1-phosphate receptor 1-like n=1 Tax=Octopus sinensis TaxID=2607531 RepID=A0A7E6EMD1_9MOLL|nr:sphingosine 1-phosphate receptor 1-like [Octopus sinensis]